MPYPAWSVGESLDDTWRPKVSRRLDIGIASYGSPELLKRTVESVIRNSVTDWRLYIYDNLSDRSDEIRHFYSNEAVGLIGFGKGSINVIHAPNNYGYAGAVYTLQKRCCETEYIAYLDNDVEIQTHGWDEALCSYLDRFHEIGMIFPNGGAYPIARTGGYQEVMWGLGYAWILSRLCMSEVGYFDTNIGHQNECDYAMRVRMAGWKCAAAPEVRIDHLAKSTNEQTPESTERIGRGVREFVDKWCRYFCGKNVNYHSPNVLRWEDWPPNALYFEEYWRLRTPDLNARPEVYEGDNARELIKVPRLKDFYNRRIV